MPGRRTLRGMESTVAQTRLAPEVRPWMSRVARDREAEILADLPETLAGLASSVTSLVEDSRRIHERDGLNLNPATNVMNPAAEALLAAGLGSRPSLGHPGEKYETGLESVEQIEVVAAALAGQVMGARYAEIKVPSGSIANLYAFMATCQPGDAVIVPPPSIGGHVTHDRAGAAGLYGLRVHHAPIDAGRYTVDVAGLAVLAEAVKPRLITVGGSLNLLPHPVAAIREVADAVGAKVLFDAAHACGMIAWQVWPNPLAQGADLLTMSTYKSLGGPPAGLVLTNDVELAERVDQIAHPGLTANFDVGNTAALAITLLDWLACGRAYAATMVATAQALAAELGARGMPIFQTDEGTTTSHQIAVVADSFGGGSSMAQRLRQANLLASAIGLPVGEGLRLGTPELVRWGMGPGEMPRLAELLAAALSADPTVVARQVTAFRAPFDDVGFIRA